MLHHIRSGVAGRPVVAILHGLFGNSQNWASISNRLSQTHEVYALDLRNHGKSPHHPTMAYEEMARDVHEFMQAHSIANCKLVGHSMGGRVAMICTGLFRVDKLVVVDVAPRTDLVVGENAVGQTKFLGIVGAMQQIVESNLRKDEATRLLLEVTDSATMQFLLTNMTFSAENGTSCRLNLKAIKRFLELGDVPHYTQSNTETLFVRGTRAKYITDGDRQAIERLFPNSRIAGIDCGHWVHVERPKEFISLVSSFL